MADPAETLDQTESDSPDLDRLAADENWQRYEYVRDRGHVTFCEEVRRLEDYTLGGGLQWEKDDKDALTAQGRMALEFNQIMPAVKAALAYQIANRMDISFRPRGGVATQEIANVLSKVAMQIADNTELHWKETEVFADGLIQRRGFYDIRIEFDDSMRGEVRVEVLDPMDVLPDPDAKSYDPDHWNDVITTRWLTLDEVDGRYGSEARKKLENSAEFAGSNPGDSDFGDGETDDEHPRSKFGDDLSDGGSSYDSIRRDRHLTRFRIVDRQKFVYKMCNVIVSPDTGDITVTDGMDGQKVIDLLAKGGIPSRRMSKRVRWIVSTCDTLLHDDWSPYPFFTVTPYFPFFRRGRSRGMVDNAVGPQNALNKAVSQYIHIVNSTANSGWVVEEGSLTNMTTDDLEEFGAKTGVVIEYKKGTQKPEKIQPAQIPTGVDKMIDRLTLTLKENTVPDAARGLEGQEKSGVAIQSRQKAAQQQLAVELDNLSRTRKRLAKQVLWMIQNYYDDERLFRITKQNPVTGQDDDEELRVNYPHPETGEILNDLTLGEYDVIVAEQPKQVTFEDGQFSQAIEMKKVGVNIPDDVLIRNSNLAEKGDLLQRMASAPAKPDPLTDAKVSLTLAQAQKVKNDSAGAAVQAQFSAIQTANNITANPAAAPIADALLKSGGFVDQDAPPIVPNAPEGLPSIAGQIPQNTSPQFPAHASRGLDAGIEGGSAP